MTSFLERDEDPTQGLREQTTLSSEHTTISNTPNVAAHTALKLVKLVEGRLAISRN